MKIVAIIIIAASAVVSIPAFAQQRQMPPAFQEGREGGDRRGGVPNEKREEIRKKIGAIMIWRMTEELKLDEKTAAKFLPVISSIEQRRRDLLRENAQNMRELRFYSEGKTDENKISDTLENIEKNRRELAKLQEKEMQAAKDHLSPEQQARYLVFRREFEKEIQEIILRARNQGFANKETDGGGDQLRPQGPPPFQRNRPRSPAGGLE